MTRVYKIIAADAWAAARAAGVFEGSSLDLKDGYIHLSTAAQAGETARLHFHGVGGLLLLELEADDLGPELLWEPSRGGALFPHLHRPLRPSEVLAERPLELNAEGWPDPGSLTP